MFLKSLRNNHRVNEEIKLTIVKTIKIRENVEIKVGQQLHAHGTWPT